MHPSFLLPIALFVLAADLAQAGVLHDGLVIHRWGDFKSGTTASESCKPLRLRLRRKMEKNYYPDDLLTDEEFVSLVGDEFDFVGIEGGRFFYSRKTGHLNDPVQAYVAMLGYDANDRSLYSDPEKMAGLQRHLQSFTPDKIDSNTPILCGDGTEDDVFVANQLRRDKRDATLRTEKLEATKADAARQQAELEKACFACTKPGGPLLEAIYAGDYAKQHQLAGSYLVNVAQSGGSEALAVGVIINALSRSGDLTFLEDLIGAYLLSTSKKWGAQCFGSGSFERTFTTKYPAQVYETLGGVQVGSDPGYTKITKYRVNQKFTKACDRICNKNGGILLTARLASASGADLEAVQAFYGIDAILDKHQCASPQLVQFEDNLLKMWEQEKSQPASVPRNSLARFLR